MAEGNTTISLSVRDKTGQSVGTYSFDSDELAPRISKQLLHDVVVMHESNCRVGTVMTRNRAQTEGTTKKLFRQKGTGRARMGTIRTNIRRGGGHAHAIYPVEYNYRLPKKAVRLATRMALLSKFLDDQVTLVSELPMAEPKTRAMAGVLKALGLAGTKCLLTIDQADANVWQAGRNIPNLWISAADDLNAYDLLHQKQLIITKAALDRLRAKGKEAKESSKKKSTAKSPAKAAAAR